GQAAGAYPLSEVIAVYDSLGVQSKAVRHRGHLASTAAAVRLQWQSYVSVERLRSRLRPSGGRPGPGWFSAVSFQSRKTGMETETILENPCQSPVSAV